MSDPAVIVDILARRNQTRYHLSDPGRPTALRFPVIQHEAGELHRFKIRLWRTDTGLSALARYLLQHRGCGMRVRIPLRQLRVGMYVAGIDGSWFRTPFLKHRFLVKSEEQIERLRRSNINAVDIDPSKGFDVGSFPIVDETLSTIGLHTSISNASGPWYTTLAERTEPGTHNRSRDA